MAALTLAVLGAFWQFVTLPDAGDRLDAFPESGYGFASRDVGVDDSDRAVFGDARILKRDYQIGDQEVLLRVVDPSQAGHSSLDPEFFFGGTGWMITQETSISVPGGQARHLNLRRHGRSMEAVVWYSDLRTRHASSPREWWQRTLRRLSFGTTGPASVLVILQAPPRHSGVDWDDLFDRFPALFEL